MVLCSIGLMQSVALYLFLKRQPSSVYLVCFIKLFCIINFPSMLFPFWSIWVIGGEVLMCGMSLCMFTHV